MTAPCSRSRSGHGARSARLTTCCQTSLEHGQRRVEGNDAAEQPAERAPRALFPRDRRVIGRLSSPKGTLTVVAARPKRQKGAFRAEHAAAMAYLVNSRRRREGAAEMLSGLSGLARKFVGGHAARGWAGVAVSVCWRRSSRSKKSERSLVVNFH